MAMQPHLVRWQNQYFERGLDIVYVADGRRVSEQTMTDMAAAVPFSICYDASGAAMNAYGVRAYPTAYIMDVASGKVLWEGIPSFNPQAVEQAVLSALGR